MALPMTPGWPASPASKIPPQEMTRLTEDLRSAQRTLMDLERSIAEISANRSQSIVQIQLTLNKQAQMTQVLSNTSKRLQDTIRSILSNLK